MSSPQQHTFIPWRFPLSDGHLQGYRSDQADAKATIHFLHGNGFAVRTYSELLSQLQGYNLILQEAAGHGESSPGEAFIGWNETAQRFYQSLQTQHTAKDGELIGMGHSFGGCMTALMSVQDPSLFSRMVLLDPAFFPPRQLFLLRITQWLGLIGKVPVVRQAMRRRTQWEHVDKVKANYQGRGTFKGWQDKCLDDYIQHSIRQYDDGHCELICPTWMEAAIFGSSAKGLWRSLLKISVPTYIVMGKDTFPMFKKSYRLAAKLNRNIRLVETAGGHCFMQEDPQGTAELVQAILNIEE